MNHSDVTRSSAVERYLLDEMTEVERFEFEAHYFDCDECAEDVRAAAAMREGVRSGLLRSTAPAALPFRSKPARTGLALRRSTIALPWAAAAVLAVALGYQTLGDGNAVRPGPEVLTPYTLRPESRGAVPVVEIQPGRSMVTLAIDVPGAGRDDLLYDLRDAADRALASGRIAAPPPGAPLLLAVPVWTIVPGEHYILSVRRASDQELLGEFRFAVAGP